MTDIEIPLPGDQVDGRTVVASCWTINGQGHDASVAGLDGYYLATVILLNNRDPYYQVTEIGRKDDSDGWHAIRLGDFHPNIIPASENYSNLIGGY